MMPYPRIDAFASAPWYLDHILPVWLALPPALRGIFAVHPSMLVYARPRLEVARLSSVFRRRRNPVITAAYGDLRTMGHRPVILMEHGAGQSYIRPHPSYAGGPGRATARLFLNPSERVAALNRAACPSARQAVIGSPKMDRWLGRAYPRHNPPVVAITFHWDCFPGDVVVSGPPIIGTVSRWFEGDLVVIRTASGNELACTPNHPVLTPEGWVAAGTLDPGRHLVRRTGPKRMVLFARPDQDQVPSRIEDVARAVQEASAVVTMSVPVAAQDFHGDGIGSDVAVVATDRALLDDTGDAAMLQPAHEGQFLGTGLGETSLASDRPLRKASLWPVPTADRSVGGGGHSLALRAGEPRMSAQETLAETDMLTGLLEPSDHRALTNPGVSGQSSSGASVPVPIDEWLDIWALSSGPEAQHLSLGAEHPAAAKVLRHLADRPSAGYSEALRALTGEVLLDEIVEVGSRSFQGHVYNLQTTDSWYEANGFIVHNCTLQPETRGALDHYRAALPALAREFTVLGHGHPRLFMDPRAGLAETYRSLGIEVVQSFDEVLERADLFVADNTSALYEFAATGRPVVVMNAPWYRRTVEHGLRFWEFADVGLQVDEPGQLVATVERALRDPKKQRERRAAIVREVYGVAPGTAAQTAATAIASWLGVRAEVRAAA